jgi:SagB-type dehydrogenase family enzyme
VLLFSIFDMKNTKQFKENYPIICRNIVQYGSFFRERKPKTQVSTPSAGALYPLEVYLVAENVAGLPVGIYRYNAQQHALELRCKGNSMDRLCRASYSQRGVGEAAASIVLCAAFEKDSKKYGNNARKYVCMEVGCAAENVCLQAVSEKLGTVFVAGFDPEKVRAILGLPREEEPMCILPIGNLKPGLPPILRPELPD